MMASSPLKPSPEAVVRMPSPQILARASAFAKAGSDDKLEAALRDFYWSYSMYRCQHHHQLENPSTHPQQQQQQPNTEEGGANIPLKVRLRLYELGAVTFCKNIIEGNPTTHSFDVVKWAFYIVADAASVLNGNDPRENITVVKGVMEAQLLPLAIRELEYIPIRPVLLQLAFTIINAACSAPELVNVVLETGLHTRLIRFLQVHRNTFLANATSQDHLQEALKSLSWLAWHCPSVLRRTEAVDIARQYIPLLNHPPMTLIGFVALRVVIRMLNPREAATIENVHEEAIGFYAMTLDRALRSGPKKGFLVHESNWNLSGIICDLWFIAASLENTAPLAVAISPVLRAVYLYGGNNLPLIKHAMAFLCRIHGNSTCRLEIVKFHKEVERLRVLVESECTFGGEEKAQITAVYDCVCKERQ